MKAGAEPKKVAILAVLLLVAALVLYFNVFSGDSTAPVSSGVPVASAPAEVTPTPVAASPRAVQPGAGDRRRASKNSTLSEFKIRQGVEPGQEKPDPSKIDPTLRLDLLAKLQKVEPAAMRNIFQYGAAPPPTPANPVDLPKNVPRIAINQPAHPAAPSGPPPPPAAPTAPPMTFKYYGYKVSKADGRKEAFLLDGDDIIIAAENESVKRGRYKVIRIGINSITIEDTQFKSTQTLALQEDAAA